MQIFSVGFNPICCNLLLLSLMMMIMVMTIIIPFNRYEDEINKRTACENDFVVLKKVSNIGLRIITLTLHQTYVCILDPKYVPAMPQKCNCEYQR